MVLQSILTKVFISNIENSTAIQVPLEIFLWTLGGSRTPGEKPWFSRLSIYFLTS